MNPPFDILPPRLWFKVDGGWILQGGVIFPPLDGCKCSICSNGQKGQAAQFFKDDALEDEILQAKAEFLEFERKHMVL